MAFAPRQRHSVSGYSTHVNTAYTAFSIKMLYNNLITLCLNGTLLGVDFMDVIIGDHIFGVAR